MTKFNKKHYDKSLKNLNYPRPLGMKRMVRQNKHKPLVRLKKYNLKKKRVLKLHTKKLIRKCIYKRRMENVDEDGRLKRRHSWKDRFRYASRNKWRFWSYSNKLMLEQKRENFQKQNFWSKKPHKKRYWINKFAAKWRLNRNVTQIINNFNKSKNFSKKLRILTKKIYYNLLIKKNFKMVTRKKGLKQKIFLAQFLPYKWQIAAWKLKQPQNFKKNFLRRFFYDKAKLQLKRKQRKLTFKSKKRLHRHLRNYLFHQQQISNYKKKRLYNFKKVRLISQKIPQYLPSIGKSFIDNSFKKLRNDIDKYLRNIRVLVSLKKIRKNKSKLKLIKWLNYQKRLSTSLPKLKNLKLLKNKQKLKKINYKIKKQNIYRKWLRKNPPHIRFGKKAWKIRRHHEHRPRKEKYMWYNNLSKKHEMILNVNKKNRIRLESPFFKKVKNLKKIKYLIMPKKYKNIFKKFYFKNIQWRKSFLLNKKLRIYEKLGKKKVINEYNWKKTREEPWFKKRANWLSWVLHTKNKGSPFFIGTSGWNSRWHFYYEKHILQKLNTNKHIRVQVNTTALRPFIRNFILKQKHLPTIYLNDNDYLQWLFIQDSTKVHWTDYAFVLNEPREVLWRLTNLTEKTINIFPSNENLVTIEDEEDQPFLPQLLHDVKKSSFILYKNWPRQIFQHTTLLKNVHKRIKLIWNIRSKEWLEYQNPQPRFEKFHRLFSIDWRINKAAPWFEPLFFPRIVHPVQYFNFWYSKKSIYIRKRSKIYRQFSKEAFNLYEPLKYRSSRRGGHRNFNWNRILSKVLLPFFGQTFSQFQSSFNKLRLKKSKQISRATLFTKNLNSQLYRLIYNFNITPSIFWARKVLKAGWVYVFSSTINSNTKMFFNSLSIDKLFPMAQINKNYSQISSKSAKFTKVPTRVEWNKVNGGSAVVINPAIKLLIKEFFSRRLNWDRRVVPSYGILNRKKNIVMISQQRYKDNFSEYTKDRSNTKKFPFLYN